MTCINKILVATDLSKTSRCGLIYACSLAAENKATLIVLHVANEFECWEFYSEDFGFPHLPGKRWPADRALSEAVLDLNRYLEPHLETMKQIPLVTKRVILGPVAQRIAAAAEDEGADLVILSPRRHCGLRHWFTGGITDRVTRLSPCPVLSVTPPLPSRNWGRRLMGNLFGWPRQRAAEVS